MNVGTTIGIAIMAILLYGNGYFMDKGRTAEAGFCLMLLVLALIFTVFSIG